MTVLSDLTAKTNAQLERYYTEFILAVFCHRLDGSHAQLYIQFIVQLDTSCICSSSYRCLAISGEKTLKKGKLEDLAAISAY